MSLSKVLLNIEAVTVMLPSDVKLMMPSPLILVSGMKSLSLNLTSI